LVSSYILYGFPDGPYLLSSLGGSLETHCNNQKSSCIKPLYISLWQLQSRVP
jgi:hypothetical protein